MVRIGAKFMPVNSTHLEYDANAAVWLRARDVFAREAAGKDNSLHKVERSTQVRLGPPCAPPGRSQSPDRAPLRRSSARANALGALSRTLTLKKGIILVKKRSSFECSINHLRRTAGKAGQVSFDRVGCGCRIEILGARAKRGAKTAMKPDWDKALVGNSDPMAGRARFRVTIREPRRAAEFLSTLHPHFFSGHLWSSLVTFGHLRFPFRTGNRSARTFLDRFLPAKSRRSFSPKTGEETADDG